VTTVGLWGLRVAGRGLRVRGLARRGRLLWLLLWLLLVGLLLIGLLLVGLLLIGLLLVGLLFRRSSVLLPRGGRGPIPVDGPLQFVHGSGAGHRGAQVAAAMDADAVRLRHAPLVAPTAAGARHLIHHGGHERGEAR
jgi:hypothetical protein